MQVGHDCTLSVHQYLPCEMGTSQGQELQFSFEIYIILSAKRGYSGVLPGRTQNSVLMEHDLQEAGQMTS